MDVPTHPVIAKGLGFQRRVQDLVAAAFVSILFAMVVKTIAHLVPPSWCNSLGFCAYVHIIFPTVNRGLLGGCRAADSILFIFNLIAPIAHDVFGG